MNSIIDTENTETLEKTILFNLMKNLAYIHMPNVFSFEHSSLHNKRIKPNKEVKFNVSLNKNHKTKGFLLKIQNDEQQHSNLFIYEIFKNEQNPDDPEQFELIGKILISEKDKINPNLFNHFSISVLQKKRIFIQKTSFFGAINRINPLV
ncbi:hypothetical protein [Candidatus Phytoplasma palmae]|uniref:hypothetical protein n=1 Tax=Candidatus Phytoplasma palmae TaxID=85624 RepID=UPI0039909343